MQNQPAALSSELDFDPYELEEYRNQHLAFELRHYLDTHASTLSFSQKKFIGFRNRTEFEKKRLLISNKKSYRILGFDQRKHVYELFKGQVDDLENDEIVFIDFLEDC